MRPHSSYLICCNPRTGSWLLAEALERTGLAGRPKEYFMREYEQEWFKRWDVSTYTDYLDKVIEAGTTANGIFGAKAHWYQFKELSPKLLQLPGCTEMAMHDLLSKLFPNLRYLWITRHDRIRQAISYYKAVRTGRWWSIDGWKYAETKEPTFDFMAIERLLKLTITYEKAWEEYFYESGIKPLVVYYEDLERDYEATTRQILRDLDIPIPADLVITEPRLKKQADSVTEEWFERYIDFKKVQNSL